MSNANIFFFTELKSINNADVICKTKKRHAGLALKNQNTHDLSVTCNDS